MGPVRRRVRSCLPGPPRQIVLTRNPGWWGTARLDGRIPECSGAARHHLALQNNTISATGVTSWPLTIAARAKGISIGAPGPAGGRFTLNGAPGSILADKALRLARSPRASHIAKSPSRPHQRPGATEQPRVFVAGQTAAGQQRRCRLQPGTSRAGAGRPGLEAKQRVWEKDGRRLVIRSLFYGTGKPGAVLRSAQRTLARVASTRAGQAGSGFFMTTSTWGFRHRTVRLGGRRVSAVIARDLRFGRKAASADR